MQLVCMKLKLLVNGGQNTPLNTLSTLVRAARQAGKVKAEYLHLRNPPYAHIFGRCLFFYSETKARRSAVRCNPRLPRPGPLDGGSGFSGMATVN